MGVQNAWVFSTNHKTTRDWVVSLVENTHAFCTRTIIGRKQGYKMREYFLPENIKRKFGWKSVSIFYHFDRTISSGIKKVAEKAQKNCFPLLRSGTKNTSFAQTMTYYFEPAYVRTSGVERKIPTVRQVLSGNVFINFHHLHPEFQIFILRRIQTHYVAKKDIQSDVTFFLVMSVST